MQVVLLAHGSRDPRHAETIGRIAATLDDRSLRAGVCAAYLDLCPPTLAEQVRDLPRASQVIVVPMLLTSAFHATVDVPAALAAAAGARPDLDLRAAAVLGPDPGLEAALDRRVSEAGVDLAAPGAAALVVAAGSSDDAARAEVAALTARWLGPDRHGTHAFASGPGPTVDEAVRALAASGASSVVVAPYLLTPGVLPQRAFDDAARVAAEAGVALRVAAVLGDADEVLDVITERARGAGS